VGQLGSLCKDAPTLWRKVLWSFSNRHSNPPGTVFIIFSTL